jgi:hypothetical protein
MRTTVPTDPADPGGARYGPGIARATYPCLDVWWHDGIVYGHAVDTLLRVDGSRQVTLATTLTHYQDDPARPAIDAAKQAFLTTAVCGNLSRGSGPFRWRSDISERVVAAYARDKDRVGRCPGCRRHAPVRLHGPVGPRPTMRASNQPQ